MSAGLLADARSWREQDPDATTRAELDELILAAEAHDPAAIAALTDRFSARLEFGTAGLRGELGAGPRRMNRVLVTQAAAGLAAYLLKREPSPSIVIGYDGRRNSEVFARDTATIMAGAGVTTTLLPRHLPTPVLAFAVRHLGASAGVMVTASHNPANDNGYKVYLGRADQGSQIVPPEDGLIAAAIAQISTVSIDELPRSTDFIVADDTVMFEYVRQTATVGRPVVPLKFVYSAMHGVGWETAQLVFEAAGFGTPAVVTEQIEPDATFPTVAFPNPEEPGAMDLTFARAVEVGADLAIVNDPDADRLAVAVPGRDGVWRRLSGNEVGCLLGWRAAERATAGGATDGGTLAASIVSSPALRAIAAEYRLGYEDTLTGFKWISRAPDLIYGFEEALGYLVDPHIVRDKDGISAAVDFLALASELKAAGRTIDDHFDSFADRFGAYASSQVSLRFEDLSQISGTMTTLRSRLPNLVGSIPVDSIDDFIDGFEQYPPGDILRIHLEGGSRVIVRPSGTEPKLKVYIDASSTAGDASERRAAANAVVAELEAGMRALLAG
ncbi:phosphomannomutase [Salinibacterium xinjiangense]|uniref:Phosphomannomutase n=1 Tax=Salinibacterium xinjiangense TaxID=386302 RepID=A0A2C8Y642_9MICO|nr:phospho-sugar mutase [Salinibacterium xinjiangense]GGK95132.1 phosphomannomutase [Salinibacterium xinjiangense]SOE45627.1 phosphomannomutase [Salinibacterium xinjiangense]